MLSGSNSVCVIADCTVYRDVQSAPLMVFLGLLYSTNICELDLVLACDMYDKVCNDLAWFYLFFLHLINL